MGSLRATFCRKYYFSHEQHFKASPVHKKEALSRIQAQFCYLTFAHQRLNKYYVYLYGKVRIDYDQ